MTLAAIPAQRSDTDPTGSILAAILREAVTVADVHGIHAVGALHDGGLVVITAASDADVEALADHLFNGHAVGHAADGVYYPHALGVLSVHLRVATDVLS